MSAGGYIDAVFEGGGVKGSALVGAVAATEALGYEFKNVAGTSAGAIVASLVAAGYTAEEMTRIMDGVEYSRFKDPTALSRIPLAGGALSLLIEKGIYAGDYFTQWLADLLAAKGVRTFGDLVIPEYAGEPRYRYRLQVIASDISRGRLLSLPQDIRAYGIDPDALSVAAAVRMSMSIPYFYTPVALRGAGGRSYVVDGGILSNFPVWLFDDGTPNPPWPTIGYKLVDPDETKPHAIRGPVSLFSALFSTMMEAHDARYLEDSVFVRTVPIPTLGVTTTAFDITPEKKRALYDSGLAAAQEFFGRWDFAEYKERYRRENESRTERVWAD